MMNNIDLFVVTKEVIPEKVVMHKEFNIGALDAGYYLISSSTGSIEFVKLSGVTPIYIEVYQREIDNPMILEKDTVTGFREVSGSHIKNIVESYDFNTINIDKY